MKLFKVRGTRTQYFEMTVTAKDKYKAYDIAAKKNTIDWTEIETDEVIEPFDVEEDNG